MFDLVKASEVVFRTTRSDGRTVDSHFDLVPEDTLAVWELMQEVE